jgi:hypothetical protein
MNDDAERLLDAQEPPIADLARALCDRILSVFPGAVVTADRENIGFGTGTGYQGLVFTVIPHRAHVTLGVANAVGLPDPSGLLEGTGKRHRHVKIRSDADLDRPDLHSLLQAALNR